MRMEERKRNKQLGWSLCVDWPRIDVGFHDAHIMPEVLASVRCFGEKGKYDLVAGYTVCVHSVCCLRVEAN